MVELRRILCAVDFSDHSRRALAYAAALAARYGAAIELLHVYAVRWVAAYAPGAPELPSTALTPEDRAALLQQLQRFAADTPVRGAPIQPVLREGDAAGAVLDEASSRRADLLVIGTHGRSGFQRLILGSVAEKLVRKARCPVLTVPPAAAAPPAAPAAFRRILCAVDFSDASMRALAYGLSLARETEARLTVAHVVAEPPDMPTWHETTAAGPRSLADYVRASEEDGRMRLDAAVPESLRAHGSAETVVATGKPHTGILRIAAEQAADLIVMGAYGHGALDQLFFGSTAQHVVRQAACPVLTVRA